MKHTNSRSPILLTITCVVALFIVTPMCLSVYAGLITNYNTGLSSGLTLRWVHQVFNDYGPTITWSLLIALATVVATLVLGIPCAYTLARSRSRWANAFEELITLPVAVPGLATALAMILAYGQVTFFRQSFLFILVGHILFTLPFMVRVLASSLRKAELVALEEASRTLGARFSQSLTGILIPAILPAILAGCLMVFTLSVGEFNLTWMLHTPLTRTLPVGLADSYASMRIEVGSAYTLIFFIVILPVLMIFQYLVNFIQKHYGH